MDTKASISPGYRWRLGLVALFCLGFSGWFFYDGSVTYPRIKAMHEEYERIKAERPIDYVTAWESFAGERGWPTELPAPKGDTDIYTQFLLGALTGAIGLWFGVAYLRAGGRWIAADAEGLHTSWGQKAPWSSLTSIDKARWKTKGIAVVRYTDGAAGERKITLDDWKYDRDATTQLVARVDTQLGNPPETAAETPPADTPPAEELAR